MAIARFCGSRARKAGQRQGGSQHRAPEHISFCNHVLVFLPEKGHGETRLTTMCELAPRTVNYP
jgi:hypothetical protein